MEKYAFFFIGVIVVNIILIIIDEVNKVRKIQPLKAKIQNLERCRGEMEKIFFTPPNAPFILDNEIAELNLRADTLKFCYQCPLYQDKVRECKKQTLKEQQ